jgi:hypothetical protein
MFLVKLDPSPLHDVLNLATQQAMFATMSNVARIPLEFYHLVEQSSIVATSWPSASFCKPRKP